MRQQLYENQINFFRKEIREKLKSIKADRDKGNLTELDYLNAKARLNGRMNALIDVKTENIYESIMKNIKVYELAGKQIIGKINLLDKTDKNYQLFYFLDGGVTALYTLLTIHDNTLSCCPSNKEIILNTEILKLEEDMENASKLKDKKTSSDLKVKLSIIKKAYEENLQYL